MAEADMREPGPTDTDAPGPSEPQPKDRATELLDTFVAYRVALDADGERRERLVTLSRSITQQSKKLIFHLHRGSTLLDPKAKQANLKDARAMRDKIVNAFQQVSQDFNEKEAVESYWKWSRVVSGGLEEFIEGASFLHYMEHKELVTIEQIQSLLTVQLTMNPMVDVTPEDYVLGLSDLTGELMRYATNALGMGDHETPVEICAFVRLMKTYFDEIPIRLSRQLSKKQEETTRSLEKIEKLCYATQLRLVEFSGRSDVLAEMAKRDLAGSADRGPPRDQEVEA